MEGEGEGEREREADPGGAGAGPSSLAIGPAKGSMGREGGAPAQGRRGALPDAVASSLQQRRVIRWERFLPRRSLRVLLVEPDDSTRHIVTALLRKCSYHGNKIFSPSLTMVRLPCHRRTSPFDHSPTLALGIRRSNLSDDSKSTDATLLLYSSLLNCLQVNILSRIMAMRLFLSYFRIIMEQFSRFH